MAEKTLSFDELKSKGLFSLLTLNGRQNRTQVSDNKKYGELMQGLSYLYDHDFLHPDKQILNGPYAQHILDLLCESENPLICAKGISFIVYKNDLESIQNQLPPPKPLSIWATILIFLEFRKRDVPKYKPGIFPDDFEKRAIGFGYLKDYCVPSSVYRINRSVPAPPPQDSEQYYDVIKSTIDPVATGHAIGLLGSNSMLNEHYAKELGIIKNAGDPESAAKVLIALKRRDCLESEERYTIFSDLSKDANAESASIIEDVLSKLNINYNAKDIPSNLLFKLLTEVIKNPPANGNVLKYNNELQVVVNEFIQKLNKDNSGTPEQKTTRSGSELPDQRINPVENTDMSSSVNKSRLFRKKVIGTEPDGPCTDVEQENIPRNQ